MRKAALLLALLLILFFAPALVLKNHSHPRPAISDKSYDGFHTKQNSQPKGIYIFELKRWLHRPIVRKMLDKQQNIPKMVFYSVDDADNFSASACGTDLRHHIVTSFLVGYSPFSTRNPLIPWLTLAQRKTYQMDSITYNGRHDIWQTSEQAFRHTRGDCEDHAIALADWLICLGKDARVVIGTYNGGGHAWVVLFDNGKEFILEATEKNTINRLTRFPLAKNLIGYRPEYMFNRTDFWKNTGSTLTFSYSSRHWVKKSRCNLEFYL